MVSVADCGECGACGECGCNCECQCDCCCNMKHVDMKLGSLFEACQLINTVTYGSVLCHTVSCKYSCVQYAVPHS